MSNIPECFYRVSVKALVLNETKDKFLICKEASGIWELPGGGLDWGASPQNEIRCEIQEEMGLSVTKVADNPSYFFTAKRPNKGMWVVNIIYETALEHLNFTPSDECVEIMFANRDNIGELQVFPTVKALSEVFDPYKHSEAKAV